MTWVKVKKKKYENIMMETPFSSILFAVFLNSEEVPRFSVSVRRSVASHYHFYSFCHICRLFILRNPCIMSSRIKLEFFLSVVTHLFFPLSLSVYLFECLPISLCIYRCFVDCLYLFLNKSFSKIWFLRYEYIHFVYLNLFTISLKLVIWSLIKASLLYGFILLSL